MKESINQVFNERRKKLNSLSKHNTNNSSPVNNKYTINGDLFSHAKNKLFFNPYNKQFNVRRLNKT